MKNMKLKRILMQLPIAGLLATVTANGALVQMTNDIASNTTETW